MSEFHPLSPTRKRSRLSLIVAGAALVAACTSPSSTEGAQVSATSLPSQPATSAPSASAPPEAPLGPPPCLEQGQELSLRVDVTEWKHNLLGTNGEELYRANWDVFQSASEKALGQTLAPKGTRVGVSASVGRMTVATEVGESRVLTQNAVSEWADSPAYVFTPGEPASPAPDDPEGQAALVLTLLGFPPPCNSPSATL